MIKKIASILLLSILCNSLTTYAVNVSDNDGAAFITKAEFDSLKNNFQTQIDAFNTGIDSKIDTAIATYLNGVNIKIEQTLEIYYSNYKIKGSDGLYWTSSDSYNLCNSDNQTCSMDVTYNQYRVRFDSGGATPAPAHIGWSHKTDYGKNRIVMETDGEVNGVAYCDYKFSGMYNDIDCNYDGTKCNVYFSDQKNIFSSSYMDMNKRDTQNIWSIHTGSNTDAACNKNVVHNFNYDELYDYNRNIRLYFAPNTTSGSVGNYDYYDDRDASLVFEHTADYNVFNAPYKWSLSSSNVEKGGSGFNSSATYSYSSGYTNVKIDPVIKVFKNIIKPADYVFKSLKEICPANNKIKNGVVVCALNDIGEVTIDVACSVPCTLKFYAAPTATGYDTASNKMSVHVNTTSYEKYKLPNECKKDEYLFVTMLPDETDYTMPAGQGKLTFKEVILKFQS